MGASDPFAQEEAQEAPPPVLHAQEALLEMGELLELVQYWREKAEALEADKNFRISRWRAARRAEK